jgi:hypothetical protein
VTKGRISPDFVVFLAILLKNIEVKNMETMNQRLNRSTQAWTKKVDRKHPLKVDYYPELKSWVQHAILEAEKNNDFSKKDQLLDLLKDL